MAGIASAVSREVSSWTRGIQFKQIDQLEPCGERAIDPDFLGLHPIAEYRYVPRSISGVREHPYIANAIRTLKNGKYPCYFFSCDNPMVAIIKPVENGPNPRSQIIWVSVDSVSGNGELKELSEYLYDKVGDRASIVINNATHGDMFGHIVADSPLLGQRAGSHMVEDLKNFKSWTNVSFNPCSHETGVPKFPSNVDYIINAWCFSARSPYTSIRYNTHARSSDGHVEPPHIRSDISGKIMEEPVFFEACCRQSSHLLGRVHYFDKKEIENLKLDQQAWAESMGLYNNNPLSLLTIENADKAAKEIFTRQCPVVECRSSINLLDAQLNQELMDTIKAFNEHIEKVKSTEKELGEREVEVVSLQGSVAQKDGEIVRLEGEKVVLEREKVALQSENTLKDGQINVLTTERDQARQERKEAVDLVGIQARRIDEIIQGQTMHAFIKTNPVAQYIGGRHLSTVMTDQKVYAANNIKHLFLGTPLCRSNGFIINPGTPDELKTRKLTQWIFRDATNTITALTRKSIEQTGLKFVDEQHRKFLLPLMERLIKEDKVSQRVIDSLKEHGVALKTTNSTEDFFKVEPDRFFGKSYLQSLQNIFSECLRYEVSENILTALEE